MINLDRLLANPPITDPYEIIGAYKAWDLYEDLKKKKILGSAKVGVLDTMFYNHHQALKDNLFSDTDFLAESSHGTHVAGIIGSRSSQARGVFPDAQIIGKSLMPKFIMPIYGFELRSRRIVKTTSISNHAINKALRSILKDQNKIVINCSFGYNSTIQSFMDSKSLIFNRKVASERKNRNTILLKALKEGKDYLLVQSSGNFSNTNKFNNQGLDAYYSSHFVSSNPNLRDRILTVGALRDNRTIWQGTQLGQTVDILAPGYRIYAPVSDQEDINPNIKEAYAHLTGTSMAAPFITGAAAMVWYLYPDLSGPEVKRIILASADELYNPADKKSYKVLNLYRALVYAENFRSYPYAQMANYSVK